MRPATRHDDVYVSTGHLPVRQDVRAGVDEPLDRAGNSVRGQLAARFLSRRLGLSLFASSPADQAGTVPRQSNSANR